MKHIKTVSCGVFDSAVSFQGRTKTEQRVTERFELEYIISADGAAIVNGTRYDLKAGTLLIIKPNTFRQSILHFKCYYMHLEIDEKSEFYQTLVSAPDCMRVTDKPKYQSLFEEFITHVITGENSDDWFSLSKLYELFYRIRRAAAFNLDEHPQTSAAVNSAAEYIERNYGSEISLSALAAAAGYSPNYFHALFTSATGITPQKYVLSVRIKHAKKQLAVTDKPLARIAYDCGFSSQSYFTMQFKSITLLTPKEYRKLHSSGYPT